MLFDLRGSGRRRVVKIVYVTLAILMGGGLVLFGIGGDVSGGLVDAITERDGSADDVTKRLERREQQATTAAHAKPDDAARWAAAARARFSLASVGKNLDEKTGRFTADGVRQLRAATAAWEKHLELAGERPDDRVASLMVQAYGALGDEEKATTAQEVIAERRESSGAYAQLALLAYQAGQSRKGDLAKGKALELTEPDMREALRGQLEQAKQQAIAQGAQGGAPPGAAQP